MNELLERLKNINVEDKIRETKDKIRSTTDPKQINSLVKKLKILSNLQDIGVSPYEAFTRKTIPVIPAAYRSPIELPSGGIYNPDINELLKNIAIANEAVDEAKLSDLPMEDIRKAKKDLYLIAEDLMAFENPKNKKFKTNYWAYNTPDGKSPKAGFFQDHVIRKRVDLSGRSVISPNPNLDMDQIEIPIEMGLEKYAPFIIKELAERGYSVSQAKSMVKNKDDKAIEALHRQGKIRPVVINRAPSIWKESVIAHWPIFVNKQNINIPNVIAQPLLGDFDGDSVANNVLIRVSGISNSVIFFLTILFKRYILRLK